LISLSIEEASILKFLDSIKKNAELVAPVQRLGELVYQEIGHIDEVSFSEGNPLSSPKEFFLPETEELFRFRRGIYSFNEKTERRRRVLFGIRPCDLAALELTDRFFSPEHGGYEDNYYWTRRRNTILLGMNCLEPEERCFCLFCGSGPFAQRGYDIQLTRLKNYYLVEVGSSQGEELISNYSHLFSSATPEEKKEKELLAARAEREFSHRRKIDFPKVTERLLEDGFSGAVIENEFWEEIGGRCLDCGGCSYVCPTCTCFSIVDKADRNRQAGDRVRIWDSCNFSGFTRMASGANPGANKRDRIKKRFFCKLLFSQQNQGLLGCVGCGRCWKVCYGEIDLSSIAHEIQLK